MRKVKDLSYPCTAEELKNFIEQYEIKTKINGKNIKNNDKENMYLYVISFKDGAFYVGHTGQDIEARMTKYFRRERTNNDPVNISKHRPVDQLVRLIDLGIMTTSEASIYEDILTIKYMIQHGYEKVRGGSYTGTDEKNSNTLKNKGIVIKDDKLFFNDEAKSKWELEETELNNFSVIYEIENQIMI